MPHVESNPKGRNGMSKLKAYKQLPNYHLAGS